MKRFGHFLFPKCNCFPHIATSTSTVMEKFKLFHPAICAPSARNMNSKQLFSWQHDITMNETEILGVRLRDFVRSSNGLCSHTVPTGKSKGG